MNSHKFRRLLIDIVGWCAIGAWRSGKLAQRPIEGFANGRLDRLWKSVTSAGSDLAGMDESQRHALRIQFKKLRYAIEFLEGIYKSARDNEKRFASAGEQLQESLGRLNDITTAQTFGAKPAEQDWLIGWPASGATSWQPKTHCATCFEPVPSGVHTTKSQGSDASVHSQDAKCPFWVDSGPKC